MRFSRAQHEALDPILVHPSGVCHRVFPGGATLLDEVRQHVEFRPRIPKLESAPALVALVQSEVLLLPELANLHGLLRLRPAEPHAAAAALVQVGHEVVGRPQHDLDLVIALHTWKAHKIDQKLQEDSQVPSFASEVHILASV